MEPNIAAEIVFHAQSVQRGAPAPFRPNPAFGVPPLPPPPPPIPPPSLPAVSSAPNLANLIGSLDGPTLQSVLSALQQRPPVQTAQPPYPAPNQPPSAADLASILNNAARPSAPGSPEQPMPPNLVNPHAANAPPVSDPNLMSLLAKGLGGQQPPNQNGLGPHVQNIVNQLSKWKQ